ncbi:hypothetical protein ACQKWADRAFT_294484 [Trichoderma austrokoningii]
MTHDSPKHEHISECIQAKCKSTCESEPEVEKCEFEYSFTDSSATWTNENGQTQSIDGVSLDINVDTLTTNTAMFRLSCSLFLKRKDNNRLWIYLFILPPSIHTIKLETSRGRMFLHFCMDRNAALIAPKDDILGLKAKSQHLLNLMKALSLVKQFTIQLGNTEMSESIKSSLGHVASIFSPTNQNRPSTNEKIADFKSLYYGKGGEIINATAITASISEEGNVPPVYPPNKRKRKREQSVSGNVKHDSRKDLEARLARMEACLGQMQSQLVKTQSQLNKTQSQLAKMEARVAELETGRDDSGGEGSDIGEYVKQEVASQVEELIDEFINSDTLENMVENLVEKHLGHLKFDMDDIFAEKEDDFKETAEEIKQEVMKDCREVVLEQVKRHLTELIDTRLEFSFNRRET